MPNDEHVHVLQENIRIGLYALKYCICDLIPAPPRLNHQIFEILRVWVLFDPEFLGCMCGICHLVFLYK